MRLDDTVTWEAKHFGLRRRMSVRITGFDRPRWFRDEMTSGPFRRMHHDHWFTAADGGTEMRDAFEFSSMVRPLDSFVLAPYLRRFLVTRNDFIRRAAETDEWRRYLHDSDTTLPQ